MIKEQIKKYKQKQKYQSSYLIIISSLMIISIYFLSFIICYFIYKSNLMDFSFNLMNILFIGFMILFCLLGRKIQFYLESNFFPLSIPEKLMSDILSLQKKLNLDEKYYEELYHEIELILGNSKELILEELPEYKKLFDKKLELQNQEIKDLYNQQQEIVKQKIELNDFLVENVDDFQKSLDLLNRKITIEKQNLIVNKEE